MQTPQRLHRVSLVTMFTLLSLILLPSCIIVVEEDDDHDYYRRRWSLDVVVYRSTSLYPNDGSLYTLSLNEADVFSGNADCTDFEGGYTVGESNTLRVQRLSVGDPSCAQASLFDAYLNGLKEARSFTGSDQELVIHYGEEGSLMRFSPVP